MPPHFNIPHAKQLHAKDMRCLGNENESLYEKLDSAINNGELAWNPFSDQERRNREQEDQPPERERYDAPSHDGKARLLDAFRHLSGVDINDRYECINQLFLSLRHSEGAIDYFPCYIVFPKELKEFPNKLSASDWGLGQVRPHPNHRT